MDVLDTRAVALTILGHTAGELSDAMLPLAELSPTNSLSSFGNITLATDASATTGISIQWPCDGFAVGIFANVRTGLVTDLSQILLRVQVDTTDELFPSATGNGPGFLPLTRFNGIGTNAYRFRRTFVQSTYWNIFLDNTTGGPLTVDIVFDYVNTKNPKV